MPRLYELAGDMMSIIESEDFTADQLDQIKLEFSQKVENCAKAIRILEAEAEAFSAESKRMAEKAGQIKGRIDSLKEYVKHHMEIAGVTNVKGQLLTVAIQKSPLSVRVVSEDAVPPEYRKEKIVVSFDNKAIANHIKETGEVPDGVEAHQGTHIRIR